MNPDWKAKVGEGTAVNWPVGAGGKGNEGVSAFVQRLPNSIGYVEYAYAKQNKIPYVLMQNAAGTWVAPDDTTFKAAAAGAEWQKSFNQVLTNQAGKEAWPITGATFIMMHTKQDKPQQAAAALKFFDWAYANGDKMADDLDYVALPDSVKALIRQQWTKIARRRRQGGPDQVTLQVHGGGRCAPGSSSSVRCADQACFGSAGETLRWTLHCPRPPFAKKRRPCRCPKSHRRAGPAGSATSSS